MTNLENLVKYLCETKSYYIKDKNMQLEREYFSCPSNNVPLSDIMQGGSYEDHLYSYKQLCKTASPEELRTMLTLLEDYFYFSAGHDMMYKIKLRADMYVTPVMEEFMFPLIMKEVKKSFNDLSIDSNNLASQANIDKISGIINLFIDMQALLNLLYCSDFQFPNGWEAMSLEDTDRMIEILNESGMKIGDFLRALIDYKCGIMLEVVSEMNNGEMKSQFNEYIQVLRDRKHAEVNTFAHANLPITYFLNHTIMDFIRDTQESIFDDNKDDGAKKLILPNDN